RGWLVRGDESAGSCGLSLRTPSPRSRRPPAMPYCPRCTLAAVALLAVAFLGGCDTNNPGASLSEVDGTYSFTSLLFNPNTAGLPDADVLARLDSADTLMEIFSDGDAEIVYRFEGEGRVRVLGAASATRSTVTFTASGEPEAQEL